MRTGLYELLEEKKAALAHGERRLADADISPQEKYQLEWAVKDLGREVVTLQAAVAGDEQLIKGLADLIDLMEATAFRSRDRAIVLTHLEEAQDRRRRELGDREHRTSNVQH